MRVELGAEAQAELEEATGWYLTEGLDHGVDHGWGLAERFVDEVERSVGLVAEPPRCTRKSSPEFV